MPNEPTWPPVWEAAVGDPSGSPREWVTVPLREVTRPAIASILADAEELAAAYEGRAALTVGFFRHFATAAWKRLETDTPNVFLIGVIAETDDPMLVRDARGHIMAHALRRTLDPELTPRVRAVWQRIFDDLDRRQSA